MASFAPAVSVSSSSPNRIKISRRLYVIIQSHPCHLKVFLEILMLKLQHGKSPSPPGNHQQHMSKIQIIILFDKSEKQTSLPHPGSILQRVMTTGDKTI